MRNKKNAYQPPEPLDLQNPPPSYEAALEELRVLVQKLESGQLALDDLLQLYQRGSDLLGFCHQKLQTVEDQIQVLQAQGDTQAWQSGA